MSNSKSKIDNSDSDNVSDCDSQTQSFGNQSQTPLTPPKPAKKLKRMCRFNDSWKSTFAYINSVTGNIHRAYCALCKREFGIGHGGEGDIKVHMDSESHKSADRVAKQSGMLSRFMVSAKDMTMQDEIIAAELSMIYHSVYHSHSYRSLDCTLKLIPVVFKDSAKACKISCGRTKAEAIVVNVLAPYTVETIINDLENSCGYFSVASDASNHGYTKLFPVVLRYFKHTSGVVTRLLDFYEDSDETAAAITEQILNVIIKNGLSMNMVSSYSADNASVNFGKHDGVYKKLQTVNEHLLPAGCPAHILHNTAKKACDILHFDVESLILKVYNSFSISAKRVSTLKEMFDFVDIEWSELLRHVPTRWLSLFPAIDRLLKNWPAVKAYFQSIGKEETPKVIWNFISDESGEAVEDDTKTCVPFLYLNFLHNCLPVFQNAILKLERDDLIAVEVYEIMVSVRDKLEQRQADHFFGFEVGKAIKKMPAQQARKIESEFLGFYRKAVVYLEQWFDFSDNNYLCKIKCLSLNQPFTFDSLVSVVESLHLDLTISMDELYEEYSSVSQHLQSICTDTEDDKRINCDVKWSTIVTKAEPEKLPNLLKVIAFVMSIPSSNAAVERVFSIMGSKWSDTRNRCSTELIKAELQVSINFEMNCPEFYNFAKQNKKLLQCARSDQKYTFRH